MQSVTIKLPDTTIETFQEIAEEEYDGNRSDAIRDLIDKGMDYDDLERENERLQRQLAAVNARQDDVTEIVEYVEEERSWREAGLGTRMKWWIFGKDY